MLFLECTYCGQFYETIPISELADRIDAAIENFFNPTNLDDGPRWDRDPDGDPLPAIIERYADVSEEVAKDLAEILKDMWFDRDAMCHQYGEDPYFVEKKPEISVLSNTWQRMEHSLKHEARLVNPVVVGVLSDLFGPILEDRTYEGKEVVAEIGNGSQVEFLYRARVFQTTRAMEHALSHPERHLGPPPEGEGAAGRMVIPPQVS